MGAAFAAAKHPSICQIANDTPDAVSYTHLPSAWAKEATDYCKRKGIFAGDGAGNYGWQKPITREATAQIIYNLLEAAGMLEKLPDVK